MRGLMVKDLRLMWMQKQFFIMIIVITALMVMMGQDTTFVVSYCTALGTYFTLSTLSYDEYDNGYAFLFTLPISRRGYVAEKYLFGGLCAGAFWLTMTIACGIYEMRMHPDTDMAAWVIGCAVVILVLVMMLSVMLPLRLKFGAERGRIVMLIAVAVFFALVALAANVKGSLEALSSGVDLLNRLSPPLILAGVLVLFAAVLAASVAVSFHIMEKKQF